IITVNDELEHVKNYLMIQEMRYKNRFTYRVTAGEEVLELASLKLILQPLVENSIYHGMEFMDGDGEISIRAYRCDDDLYFEVKDNGLGMTESCVKSLLDTSQPVESQKDGTSKGSGIGVRNVNNRIKLYFGEAYGLTIESEPDEGTTITIHLPAMPYSGGERKE
ncbi:MAG: ATP-binding protein, partial [Clostridium sp.]